MQATDTNHPDPADPAGPAPASAAGAAPNAADRRSASLLPAGDDDPDGRFAVAEEVSLDQQSDEARRIGTLPPDPAPGADLNEAVAGSLTPGGPGESERAPPEHSAQTSQPLPDDGGSARS